MGRSYRIWVMWTDRSELTGTLIKVAAWQGAREATACAVRMGIVSGLGADRRYRGVHAQEVKP